MIHPSQYRRTASALAVASVLAFPASAFAQAEETTELKARISGLEQELARTRAQLEASQAEVKAKEKSTAATTDTGKSNKIAFDLFGGTLNVGGAMRANYAVGDYGESTGGPSRAWRDGGNFSLDTYRINLDYTNDNGAVGKLEYRFYDGYSFLHTGWLGYNFKDGGQLQVGLNRAPFGPGPYGVSQSWFFDQHYYVGLSDNMNLGFKYTRPVDNWTLDAAYYVSDGGTYAGHSKDSARYSYDVVNESGRGYEERNQANLRAIYHFKDGPVPTDLGASVQYGQLKSKGSQDDGTHWAASVHMVNKWNNFTLASQLTRYEFDVDAAQPLGTRDLVEFGAYDFPNTVAAKAWIPAVSLSYKLDTPRIPWLDYVVPYLEYSSIIKDKKGFNDSDLWTLGAAWAHGGWYIYTDLAMSHGNEFVGGESAFGDRLGANADDKWQKRFNINFGYYF